MAHLTSKHLAMVQAIEHLKSSQGRKRGKSWEREKKKKRNGERGRVEEGESALLMDCEVPQRTWVPGF